MKRRKKENGTIIYIDQYILYICEYHAFGVKQELLDWLESASTYILSAFI